MNICCVDASSIACMASKVQNELQDSKAKVDDLMQEGAHFVKEVVHGSKEGVPLTCLKGVVRIYGEVTTRKLLLKG